MTPAWQVREYERQKLVKRLRDQLWDLIDQCGDPDNPDDVCLDVATMIIYRLNANRPEQEPLVHPGARAFVYTTALPQIREFARVEEEATALMSIFLEKILETPLGHLKANLLSAEIHRPQEVFHASSAMTEVAFENE